MQPDRGSPAAHDAIVAAEVALGHPLASEHRSLLELSGGSELWFGQVCLVIFDADEVVAATREVRGHPGFVAFASDGGPMIFGYDARVATCPVVMIHPTSGGWHEALYQAASIAELLATRANGLPLRWDQRYEAEA